MQIPGTIITTLTMIEYQISWVGGATEGYVAFRLDPRPVENPGPGMTDTVLLAAADTYARTLAAVIEAHKPSGSTVSLVRAYSGTAGDGGTSVTLP